MRCRVLWVGFVLTAIFSCAIERTYAQDHLIPGWYGKYTDYDRALERLFAEAYHEDVKLRTLVQWPYGGESILGLKELDDRYQLLFLEPEFEALEHVSNYYSSCIPQLGFPISKIMSSSCYRSNYDMIDTLTMRRRVVDIDHATANLIMSLGTEALYRSRYSRDEYVVLHGTIFTFSVHTRAGSILTGYTHSPDEGYLKDVIHAVKAIMSAMRGDDEVERDSVIAATTDGLLHVYQKLMTDDDGRDLISNQAPSLKGCDFSIMDRFPNDFCWQAQLTSDGRINLLVANKHNDTYKYELVLLDGDDVIKRVDIIPVIDHYHIMRTAGASYTYGYSALYPWEIKDVRTMAQDGKIHFFGYFEEFELVDSHFGIESAHALILFEAILPYTLNRQHIKVEGKEQWFLGDTLFGNE
jgi:hypothetical protein